MHSCGFAPCWAPPTTSACVPMPATCSLVPLVKGAECVVMAGDQCQLPPTVLSREALR